ncbi:MAG: DUF1499 domain-containing protein [Caldimonas sp.]
MNVSRSTLAGVTACLSLLASGCALSERRDAETVAATKAKTDLACLLPSNCVDSLGARGPEPLVYRGTPSDAMTTLQAALRTFPEASVVRSEPLSLETIFTTAVGFRDRVEFRIDAEAHRIDFRSQSLCGLFDFGKNRSRMQAFAARFNELEKAR